MKPQTTSRPIANGCKVEAGIAGILGRDARPNMPIAMIMAPAAVGEGVARNSVCRATQATATINNS